jgi:hypothetical protein
LQGGRGGDGFEHAPIIIIRMGGSAFFSHRGWIDRS